MATSVTAPNDRVRTAYDRLSELLDRGDDAFIEAGPSVLQEATAAEGFFEGVETERADEEYTRALVYREPGGPVIRYMEWPPEYTLCPHEHHGRPCFEVLVDGQLFLADMEARRVTEDGPGPVLTGHDDLPAEPVGEEYVLDTVGTEICAPGDAGVVDPRTGTDIHAVYSPVRSRSLHVYPDDSHHGIGYVQTDDGTDHYRRERFQLRE